MFEKEAEEYVMREDVITENDKVPFDNGYGFQTVSFEDEVKKGFKDGAEFGYNKANEMHDLRKDPNDLPKGQINRFLFAYVKNYGGKKPMLVCYNGKWFYDANTYNDEVKVILWCEIPHFKE